MAQFWDKDARSLPAEQNWNQSLKGIFNSER